MHRSIIIGTGSYIPPVIQTNADFSKHLFYSGKYVPISTATGEVVEKFKQITGIDERRMLLKKQTAQTWVRSLLNSPYGTVGSMQRKSIN